ncbi:hypothetical protein G15_0369 [Enterococcus avium]|nr:hypothetical protein G15_0369 [Enterococcus avium]
MYIIHSLKKFFSRNICYSYKNIQVAVINTTISPIVIGLKNPLIVLPNINLSEKERYFILEHEICHVYSFDLWLKYFYEFITLVYWWNPVIWFFKKHFNQIMELKADENVIKNLDDLEKIGYVETLVKVGNFIQNQELTDELADLPSFSSKNDGLLLDRVTNIFYKKRATNEKLVLIISGMIGFFLSSSIIFEPYIEQADIEQNYISITEENSILKKTGRDTYEIHRNGEYLFEISEKERIKEFKDLKIYSSNSSRED